MSREIASLVITGRGGVLQILIEGRVTKMIKALDKYTSGSFDLWLYIAIGVAGSLILGIANAIFTQSTLYGASGSDHDLLRVIVLKGAILIALTVSFTVTLCTAVFRYARRSGVVGSWIARILMLTHFVAFLLVSLLLTGSNVYRAGDGLLKKEHMVQIGTLDD